MSIWVTLSAILLIAWIGGFYYVSRCEWPHSPTAYFRGDFSYCISCWAGERLEDLMLVRMRSILHVPLKSAALKELVELARITKDNTSRP